MSSADAILRPRDITASATAGTKARNLARLTAMGLPVPPFVVIPGTTPPERLAALAAAAHAAVGADSYAVRSSAVSEDLDTSSQAGQFLTLTDVQPGGIADAAERIIADAKGRDGAFAVIVQAYIASRASGVAFTRDPLGGRHMVIQWHRGPGAALVAGSVTPETAALFRHAAGRWRAVPHAARLTEAFLRIDDAFGSPQDIEWCVTDDAWYILQTRPITTLTPAQVLGMRHLDATLPRTGMFRYEKTGVTEVAPHPTPLTLSLLGLIFGDGGPVARAYARHGISYRPQEFLVRIGDDLFVDRVRELATLMPAMRPDPATGAVHLASLRGLWTTVRNTAALRTFSVDGAALAADICAALERERDTSSPQTALREFLRDYELVFTANLAAQRGIAAGTAECRAPLEGLAGNSLEISDASHFTRTPAAAGTPERLREMGRWLTVAGITALRTAVLAAARAAGYADPTDAYYAGITALTDGLPDARECVRQRAAWTAMGGMEFPTVVASEPPAPAALAGVSPGTASGTLATREELDGAAEPVILLTRDLTPDLAPLLDRVAAIVSERGGLLSHLAIIARERGIPVVTGAHPARLGIAPGDRVAVDGGAGTVTKL